MINFPPRIRRTDVLDALLLELLLDLSSLCTFSPTLPPEFGKRSVEDVRSSAALKILDGASVDLADCEDGTGTT